MIRNRLADGMPLQIDATLCYAKGGCPTGAARTPTRRSTRRTTRTRSQGLPPTPISSVTEASPAGGAAPADVPYKFYVLTDENGKHKFATTLAEHERTSRRPREKGLL